MDFKSAIAAFACAALLSAAGAQAANAPAAKADEATLISQGDKAWADKKLDEAKKNFQAAVAANPRSITAHMKLAGYLLANNQFTGAIETYQKTISLDNNNAKAWMGLGMAYLHTGQKELSRAAFSEAVRIEPARKAQLAKLIEEPAPAAAMPANHPAMGAGAPVKPTTKPAK